MKRVDVVIVGGSVAGSVLAKRLSDARFEVAIFDKSEFPRSKACGEAISSTGIALLGRIGLDERLVASSHGLAGYRIGFAAGGELLLASPTRLLGYAIERRILDTYLRDAALDAGAELFSERVIAVREYQSAVVVRSALREVEAQFAVLATGGTPALAGQGYDRSPTRFGTSFHAGGVYRQHRPQQRLVEIRICNGYELFITPISNGLINIAVTSGAQGLRFSLEQSFLKGIEELLDAELGFTTHDWSRVPGGGALYPGIRTQTASRILRVGDAAEQFDPIGGMGMTHAVHSALLAGEALHNAMHAPKTTEAALRRYHAARSRAAQPYRGFTRLSYFGLVRCGRTTRYAQPVAAVIADSLHGPPEGFAGRCAQLALLCAGVS